MTVSRLEMRGIRKTFPGTVANDGAELSVAPGEVHCLLGENGAGKSTLMKILAGAYQPDEGQIWIDGEQVEVSNPVAGIHAGISVIYQELDLIPDMTVAQNLFLGHAATSRGIVQRGRRNRDAREIIDRVGGTFAPTDVVRDLSVADQQLTAIGKAITSDARIIVMDEPSATLTEHELPAVFALVRRLASEGTSIVYISHRLDEVMEIGDRATILRDGRTVAVVDVADITTEDLVTAMIGQRPTSEQREIKSFESLDPVLELRHVRLAGLIDVSGIVVHPGEIVGLAGLGGAGRTTLLSAIFGAESGETDMVLHGRRYNPQRPGAAVRAGIGLVPEDRKGQGLLRELSVVRNAALAALPLRGLRPHTRAKQITTGPLKSLAVRYANADQPVGQLSGGNQQKVVLAKWLTRGVKLLLLDEPTRGIDIGAKQELFNQVHKLASSGVAVVMASSELPELTKNADTIWVMHEGKNVAQFDPAITSEEDIARVVVTGRVENR